ncbi:hypothetical protein GCM10009613_60940 [Pseudonocardia kongjuensis]|uniref:Uncharacterized protein n=1 Tax=Pseudonocardia kongjuensis TaxID=102227 RepID=A0ABP4IZG6_9PSEU
MTGPYLEPDLRTPEPFVDRVVLRWVAAAALLGVLAGAAITAVTHDVPVEAPGSAWRTDYDRGWAWMVASQHRDPRPDELAQAECRWWADGEGADLIEQRDAFVAGCDTAARMTPLEAP